jgi:hypothetical protein
MEKNSAVYPFWMCFDSCFECVENSVVKYGFANIPAMAIFSARHPFSTSHLRGGIFIVGDLG